MLACTCAYRRLHMHTRWSTKRRIRRHRHRLRGHTHASPRGSTYDTRLDRAHEHAHVLHAPGPRTRASADARANLVLGTLACQASDPAAFHASVALPRRSPADRVLSSAALRKNKTVVFSATTRGWRGKPLFGAAPPSACCECPRPRSLPHSQFWQCAGCCRLLGRRGLRSGLRETARGRESERRTRLTHVHRLRGSHTWRERERPTYIHIYPWSEPPREAHAQTHILRGSDTCTHRRLMGCVAVCVFVVGAQHRWRTFFSQRTHALSFALPRTNASFSRIPSIPRSPLTYPLTDPNVFFSGGPTELAVDCSADPWSPKCHPVSMMDMIDKVSTLAHACARHTHTFTHNKMRTHARQSTGRGTTRSRSGAVRVPLTRP